MINILEAIYTDGIPNQFSGGPNNIIYKLLVELSKKKNIFHYLSYDLLEKNINVGSLLNLADNKSLKKKTAYYLWERFKLYQKLTASDIYLPFHYLKKDSYFKSRSKAINNVDIIHSHDSIALNYFGKFHCNAKKVMTIHSKGPLSDEISQTINNDYLRKKLTTKLRTMEVENINISDVITFPSFAAKEYFEKSLETKIPKEKIKIIYNGIDVEYISGIKSDPEIFNKYSIRKQNRIVLLNIAAHAPEKNIDKLIGVINILVNSYQKDFLLINIGAAGNKTDYKKKVDELGLSKNIFFLGKLPNDDVIKFLKESDIFLMTSEKVIFDLVVIEALACNACCVVSDEGGNKEIIKDGENGYLIDITSLENVAKKITSINIRKVKEAAKLTANQFTLKKMANEYLGLYENLTNEL